MLLGLIGILAIYKGRSTLGRLLTLCSILLFTVISTPFLPNALLGPLENNFVKFDLSHHVDKIVVLGCGHTSEATLPITSQLAPCSLNRSIEAMRIHQNNPDSVFITSGSAINDPVSNAEMNKKLLLALGINEANIISVPLSKDTEDEAVNIGKLLRGDSFALVTSASHMSRAMNLFQEQGLVPIPAPTEHLVTSLEHKPWQSMLPHSQNIKKTERWWYETLGTIWLRLKKLL
jgi:uncharacterized SAM-binding protein YcdF (DUF218 family)